ncbi:peptide chain release factor N(5)-glutamine methyltransferase [Phocicoccus pinnipedialis]|uniref:Release factor glutamine methyltransferase n=1 Tax=Phocicoccus pinnipedialis TaxID=110845 RepID=A0A6V7R509_9BACL|nr:Release factor glutamine methyltransferase [Jeotgalicoccus pinnipedialis]
MRLDSHKKETRIASLLIEDLFGLNRTALISRGTDPISAKDLQTYRHAINSVIADYPYQYVTGTAHFYGRKFSVSKSTLIPRNETEELVYHVLDKVKYGRVVDIGTGTGAIGITLKLENPELDVIITDISEEALQIAEKNKQALKTDVTVLQGDILSPLIRKKIRVDVLISNPPYIADFETNLMSKSTLKHEPHSALFAREEGLYFYRQIIEGLDEVLNMDGQVFFEIGFNQGDKVKGLFLSRWPNSTVEIIKDINGLDRIIYAKWVN